MSNLNNRINKLESERVVSTIHRVIVEKDGEYIERGQVISEADYLGIVGDPVNDIVLIKVVYASDAEVMEMILNDNTTQPNQPA